MNIFFIFSVIIIGLSGIVAQVIILRELLVSFYGNELTLGIILANWLFLEALGVYFIGRLIEKSENRISIFVSLELIFSLFFPLSIYLARTFKAIVGIPFGEGVSLAAILLSSLLIILPLGFCHGGLFTASCVLYSIVKKKPRSVIGSVYTFETLGTVIGGLIVTFIFISHLNSFQTAFIISLINLLICIFFLRYIRSRQIRYCSLVIIILAIAVFLFGKPESLERSSVNAQFGNGLVLDYRNSAYGNIAVSMSELQKTFFYNGIPIITTPYPDITFVEELGNLALLLHPNPKDVLVLSGGAGGVINEILKYPVNCIDYAELDPLVIKMLRKFPSDLTRRELSDPRVNIINTDARFLIKHTQKVYDLVLIGVSRPADLITNRLFTKEFFAMVKLKLNPGGIVCVWLPGSLTYLSPTIRDINFSIINAIRQSYQAVRIIPGDYNLVFASDDTEILKANPKLLMQRLKRGNIITKIINEDYLNYRMNFRWEEWFRRSTLGATAKINADFAPYTVFLMLELWNQQFSSQLPIFIKILSRLNLVLAFAIIMLVTFAAVFFLFLKKIKQKNFALSYCIATTGFFSMLVNLILIFSFQVFYGYLYHKIGLLIAISMAGIACGSAMITRNLQRKSHDFNLLVRLEIWIILFCAILAFILADLGRRQDYSLFQFSLLFLISGFLVGLEFPLVSKLYAKDKALVGTTAGLLYFSDLAGGWFAGIAGGIVFLPVLGLFDTCLLIVLVKLLSLWVLQLTKQSN